MKHNYALTLMLVYILACAAAVAVSQQPAGAVPPDRAKGVSMHMLPKGVADLGSQQWGLVVSHAGSWRPQQQKPVVFEKAQIFLDFYRAQSDEVQQNGAWIVVTHPDAYSDSEKQLLEQVKALCRREKIPLFITRASELPNGWKRYDQ